MERKNTSRLSAIQTCWALVFDAHAGKGDAIVSAQERLLMRYYRSVVRYMNALVRDPDVADELTHEFVVRFLRGDLRQANPSRGRFRDLLKKALRNLAIDYWRRKQTEKKTRAGARPLKDSQKPAPFSDEAEADELFLRDWRTEIMGQASRALARLDDRRGQQYFAILHFKAAHPKKHSKELAPLFGASVGKPMTATAFRQSLRRAREKYADLLIAEVARSLHTADADAIEAELIELALLSFCRRSMLKLRGAKIVERGKKRKP